LDFADTVKTPSILMSLLLTMASAFFPRTTTSLAVKLRTTTTRIAGAPDCTSVPFIVVKETLPSAISPVSVSMIAESPRLMSACTAA
jgi:hypothetical protein